MTRAFTSSYTSYDLGGPGFSDPAPPLPSPVPAPITAMGAPCCAQVNRWMTMDENSPFIDDLGTL